MSTAKAKPITAYIALGSNLGDRENSIREALRRLDACEGVHVKQVSSLMENPAVGGPKDAPAFLNGVAGIETSLAPEILLDRMLEIEQGLGRIRRERNAPRTIDLDLILFGDQVIETERLQVPHPRMHERGFVLQPLVQLAPELLHPVLGRTVRQLAEQQNPLPCPLPAYRERE